MAKYKRKKRKKGAAQQSQNAHKQNGLKAFEQEDYAKAIQAWRRTGDSSLKPSLAEAHLRHGLTHYQHSGDEALLLENLEKALRYAPKDARILFHLGVAQLRQGAYTQAEESLRQAWQLEPELESQVAFPLLLIGLHHGQPVQQSAEWQLISAEQRALLTQADSFTRRPYTATEPAILRGFAAYDRSEWVAAQEAFNEALLTASKSEQAIVQRYLGNIAASNEQWDTAQDYWLKSLQTAATTDKDDQLHENLGELLHRTAEDALQNGQWEQAFTLAQKAQTIKGENDKQLNSLLAHVKMHQANQAANSGNLVVAIELWEQAEEIVGSSFRLACNLALAHEKLEDFYAAAEKWREALRRRPRSANHPDALTVEQVAQMWQRSAEAYIKTGAYDEALKVYRTAIKHDANNLPLRLTYAEALQTEGRTTAAENEVTRILEHTPDHIPALMLMGEIKTQGYYYTWGRANPTRYWQRVLELDPNHREAREALTDYHLSEAEEPNWWAMGYACEHYSQALSYSPNRPDVLCSAGIHQLRDHDDIDEAAKYFAQALDNAGNDLSIYGEVLTQWLQAYEDERAEEVHQRVKKEFPTLDESFYFPILIFCHRIDREEIVDDWLKHAQQIGSPDFTPMLMMGQAFSSLFMLEEARSYTLRSIEAEENLGEAYLSLGIIESKDGNLKESKAAFKKANRIAKREKNQALLQDIKEARELFSSPHSALFNRLLSSGFTPDMLESGNVPPHIAGML